MIKLKWMLVFFGLAIISVVMVLLIPESFPCRFTFTMIPLGMGFLLFIFSIMPKNKEDSR